MGRSREIKEGLARDDPGNKRYRYLLAASLVNSGELESGRGRPEAASPWFARAVASFEALVRDFPQNTRYRSGLGKALHGLGTLARRDRSPAREPPPPFRGRSRYSTP